MSSFFQYTIELRDRLTAGLQRVRPVIGDTIRRVQGLRSELSLLNMARLDVLRNSLSGLFSSIPFARQIFNPFLIAGIAGGRALKLGIDDEMRNASFEVLFGGAENARKMIDNVNDYAKKSTYGKEGISAAVQTMAGFGLAQERIMPNLRAIGEISMGNKERLTSLTLAFSQMSSTGKLLGQDLNQMINAGFNPLLQMSRDTGKSVGFLKNEMGKGNITAEMVATAFQNATREGGLFYGMSEKIGRTVGGQWSLAVSNINDKLLDLYNIIQPYILPVIEGFNLLLTDTGGFISNMTVKIENWYNNNKILGTTIIAITAALVGYRAALLAVAGTHTAIFVMQKALAAYEIIVFAVKNATSLWTAVQWLLNVALGVNPITLVVAGIVALLAVIAFLILKVDGWREMWQHTVEGCKLTFKLFVDVIKFEFTSMLGILMIGLNKIKQGWYAFKNAVGLGDKSENNRMLAEIAADTEARKKALVDSAKDLAATGKKAAEQFALAGGSLKFNDTSLSDVTGKIKNAVGMPGGSNLSGNTNTQSGTIAGSAANSIATGGRKSVNVTVNVGNAVHTINLTSANVTEGAAKIREIVADEFSRIILMATANV